MSARLIDGGVGGEAQRAGQAAPRHPRTHPGVRPNHWHRGCVTSGPVATNPKRGKKMKKVMGLTLAALLGLSVAVASAADVAGKVQSVDQAERVVVLDNGTKLWVAEGHSMDKLKEGAQVKASYEERDGKNIVTIVRSGSLGRLTRAVR